MTEAAETRNSRRVIQGIVATTGMDKSISVSIERLTKHAKYKKYIRKHTTVIAHDETNDARKGDTVEVMECRPLSKTKRWRLVQIVERAVVVEGEV
jgi:small subunit ribosomal protein S17